MLDCLRDQLPLILLGIGLILLGFIIAAAIIVVTAGTGGAAGGFAAAVGEVLASWWIPITVAVLGEIAVAFALCSQPATPPAAVVTAGGAIGLTAALTAITTYRRQKFKPFKF